MLNSRMRFIAMPYFLNLTDRKLKYIDVYIYLALRSFRNSGDGQCFPAHETIAELASVCRKTVIASIRRLSDAGFIFTIKASKKKVVNRYAFCAFKEFIEIPYAIFDQQELTLHEKAMLICIRQLSGFEVTVIKKDITNFAKKLGVSYKTVSSQYESLKAKGYITEPEYWRGMIQLPIINWNMDRHKYFNGALRELATPISLLALG